QANGIDSLLPGVRGDDLRVELLRRLQVVVDPPHARRLEVTRLFLVEPAQRGTVANPIHLLHGVDRLHDLRPLALARPPATVDDAEGAGAVVAGAGAGGGDLGGVHHWVRRDAGVEVAGLGAEGAILAAIAELRGQDAAKRHAVGVEVPADLV